MAKDEAGASSLYDRYSAPKGLTRAAPTRSSQLRQGNVRLNCYLNSEGVGVVVIGGPKGHGTMVQLPLECDSLEEVFPLVQIKLKLDEKMLFCADLFLPDGEVIKTFEQLVEVSKKEVPIIVGCGEPFDGSRVPQDLLRFYQEGGGRQGPKNVFDDAAYARLDKNMSKAESVREDGHGVYPNSLAVVNARVQAVEANREKAAYMRQRYLEGLIKRTEEEQDYLRAAQQNIMFHKMEEEESRLRRDDYERDRMEKLNDERSSTAHLIEQSRTDVRRRPRAPHPPSRASRRGGAPCHSRALSPASPLAVPPPSR